MKPALEPFGVANILPFEAREQLRRAAEECAGLELFERYRIMDNAIQKVKLQFPTYFQQEQ